MKRGTIYFTGLVALVVLAALTLPHTGRTVETRLQSEMDLALADRGLSDIKVHTDGQTVTLTCRPPSGGEAAPCLAQDLKPAIEAAKTLPGGYGPLLGPVTRIRIAP
ncbi:hypothetical protein [Asticcacaulis taihuensis]|uniref:hypothetical protein n=1 Tax=Asticcacaulis taihuensis TaxID=260084 RepID=UPI003F7B88B8